MATQSPSTIVPSSLITSEQPPLFSPTGAHSGTLPDEDSFTSRTTMAPVTPLDQPPPSTPPTTPATPTGTQLHTSSFFPSPATPSYALDTASLAAPSKAVATIPDAPIHSSKGGQLLSFYAIPSPTEVEIALLDAPIGVQRVTSSTGPVDGETKSDQGERHSSDLTQTVCSSPPVSPPFGTASVPAQQADSTPGTETPCTAQKQTSIPGSDGTIVRQTYCSGGQCSPLAAASVHRFARFPPRASLRPACGLPPPSYAEAVRSEGPSPLLWAGRLGDRPPTYSSRGPQPRRATMNTVRAPRRPSRKPAAWGPHPTRASCRRCRRVGQSQVVVEDVEFTHLCALALCLFGCWPCCLLPYCMASCRRVWHLCPQCGHYMGVYSPRPPALRANATPVTASSETSV